MGIRKYKVEKLSLQMDIEFICECGHQIDDVVVVPEPNFMAEKNKDSYTYSEHEIYCPNCMIEHQVEVASSFGGADCTISNRGNNLVYSVPYYPEDEFEELFNYTDNKSHFTTFQQHITSVRSLLEIDVPQNSRFSLLVMLYGHVVSAIEGYLSGMFIHKVTNSEALIRKLIETDPEFSNRNFSLKEIFERQEALKTTVAHYLKNLIFHDLKKIKPMYRDVLGYDFGNIGWLFKAVLTRHDCVHRAGHDKDGEPISLTNEMLMELVNQSEQLIGKVQEFVGPIEEPNDLPF